MQALDWYTICTFTRWYNKKHQRRNHMSKVGFVSLVGPQTAVQRMVAQPVAYIHQVSGPHQNLPIGILRVQANLPLPGELLRRHGVVGNDQIHGAPPAPS